MKDKVKRIIKMSSQEAKKQREQGRLGMDITLRGQEAQVYQEYHIMTEEGTAHVRIIKAVE